MRCYAFLFLENPSVQSAKILKNDVFSRILSFYTEGSPKTKKPHSKEQGKPNMNDFIYVGLINQRCRAKMNCQRLLIHHARQLSNLN